jgi:serine/threonine-protein kinase
MPIKLSVVAGPHAGKEFPFEGRDTFLIGRTSDCHFRLSDTDPFLSPRHCLVELNPPRCRVIDLNSRRGIKVNGERVESAELADGDEIRAGQTVFKLSIPTPAPAPAQQPRTNGKPDPKRLAPNKPPALLEIPGYVFDKEIGQGDLGVVYRATRQADGLRVSIKLIPPASATAEPDVERFLGDVGAISSLRHPNLVEILDCGAVGRLLYVVIEHVNGANGRQIVQHRGPLSVRTAVVMVAHALTGLGRLHARGKVHRDVKPTNLLVGTSGEKKVVKVTDFGLARAYHDANLGGTALWGEVGGIPAFTAPELITHPRTSGPAADQYSAAATLYYLLTGSPPHDLPENPARALATILSQDPVPIRERRADLPEALAVAIQMALHRDPEARYPRAENFRQALVADLAVSPSGAGYSVC